VKIPPALMVTLSLLSACSSIPDAPILEAPFEENAGFTAARDISIEPVPDDWWRLYNNAELDRLVEASLSANADLRVAYANLDVARAALGVVNNTRYPQTSVESGLQVDNTANQPSAFSVPSTDWDLGMSASWDLDVFGRLRASALAADADVGAREAAVDGVRVAVVADTVLAYVDFCGLSRAMNNAITLAERQERYVDLVERQLAAGDASPLEVSQAATQASSLRAVIAPLQSQRINAAYRLTVLSGKAPNTADAEAIQCSSDEGLHSPLPVGDASALLLRRPDIREAERQLAATTARIGVARAELYPRLNLGGTVGLLSGDFATTATPLLSWSFPNQGPARARIAQAEAVERTALANWDATVLNALREVESVLSDYEGERMSNTLLTAAAQHAAAYARRAAARVRLGDASGLLQVDAERTLASTQLALVQSDLRVSRVEVALFRALGGGWQIPD
jgi:NodT family efflux transporter outer membrane factor (OMF) lipoprotein